MRKTKIVLIPKVEGSENRDAGKTFHITEMPASQAEAWATRAFMSLARSGVQVPPEYSEMGMAGLAMFGLRVLGAISFEDAQILSNEMMECVRIIRDPAHPEVLQPLMEEDIEEVKTRLLLKAEVFELHTGFSFGDAKSRLT
jgi:hypothetical protein